MASLYPACMNCKKLIRHIQTRLVCQQYPKVIPHEIIMGKKCLYFEDVGGKNGGKN
jgi:hypothetical protein